MSEQEYVARQYDQELPTTLKIIKAYPDDRLDLKPAEKSKNAKDLIWTMVQDLMIANLAIKGTIDWQVLSQPAPATLNEIITAFEAEAKKIKSKLKNTKPDKFKKSKVEFFVAPKKMDKIPLGSFWLFILKDQIHHRGQLSVYIRIAGAKLPSIYGPTADEPWM
jgi:uncharacterized damage-inducible protein DinB